MVDAPCRCRGSGSCRRPRPRTAGRRWPGPGRGSTYSGSGEVADQLECRYRRRGGRARGRAGGEAKRRESGIAISAAATSARSRRAPAASVLPCTRPAYPPGAPPDSARAPIVREMRESRRRATCAARRPGTCPASPPPPSAADVARRPRDEVEAEGVVVDRVRGRVRHLVQASGADVARCRRRRLW